MSPTGRVLLSLLPVLAIGPAADALAAPSTRTDALQELSARLERELESRRGAAYRSLRAQPENRSTGEGGDYELVFIGHRGRPFFLATDNENAAATVGTDLVHPGGGFGFSLTGSATALGELGLWDGGAVRAAHVELSGRATQMDGASSNSSHATHVAGTLIAGGDDPSALGMSYEAPLACRDWNNDSSEMASAAAGGLRISNHSYGYTTGWRESSGDWYWYGDPSISETEDYGFGRYDDLTEDWDQIAHEAPYYLIFASAGNDRNDFGPGPGGQHWVWDGGWVSSTTTRDPDGGADGYDCVSWQKTAKNILVVGAVEDIPGGWTSPGDVNMSTFSGWGPTDDGRIKPDLVANGVSLRSCTASSNSSYGNYSGTSMASPNAAGSANLVIDLFESSHDGALPTAATLKAILVQTAKEAGAAQGPDYEHGWGLLNTLGACQLVQADSARPGHIREASLADGAVDEYWFTQPAGGEFRATLVWTDPPGTAPPPSLDPPTSMLVNDLDLRLADAIQSASLATWEPWLLDPANPANPATTGDNFRDNVEQIEVASLPAGDYVLRVSHEGSLDSGLDQAYSIASSHALATSPPATSVSASTPAPLAPGIRPNPFRISTTISFSVATAAPVRVEVFDVGGRRVRTLASGTLTAGEHVVEWDARDEAGRRTPSGVYFARVRVGAESVTRKLVVATR